MTSNQQSNPPPTRFSELGLPQTLIDALEGVGYETATPIQTITIPLLLEGRDVVGQAQTGTGKTAAFALPAIARTEVHRLEPQTLVLAPTRELAIQVAEAFQKYSAKQPGFRVLPIYGGQSYTPQLKGLKRGVHAVVGTPGRVLDHIKRGTLKLEGIRTIVLDEADEMLRMGFIDDVEWVLQQLPEERQIALFSATMPSAIRRIARTHLRDASEIQIKSQTATATTIQQRYLRVHQGAKLDALTRILESEPVDGVLIFARTKQATNELSDRLEARGYSVAPLNGDLDQKQRERTIARLRDGSVDLVVATDVAARGIDVERVSHVINYDIPSDSESYVHRIGRTGRAGRSGEAILFVTPREQRLLRLIERATRRTVSQMQIPTDDVIQNRRLAAQKESIRSILIDPGARQDLAEAQALIQSMASSLESDDLSVAASLILLAQRNKGQGSGSRRAEWISGAAPKMSKPRSESASAPGPSEVRLHAPRKPLREKFEKPQRSASEPLASPHPVAVSPASQRRKESTRPRKPNDDAELFRVEVGSAHGVEKSNLVGAIANEAGLDGEHIGRIDLNEDHSIIELPIGMPKRVFRDLQKTWVGGRQLKISRLDSGGSEMDDRPKPKKNFGKDGKLSKKKGPPRKKK